MDKNTLNYYRILQVDPLAEPEVIDAAYRRLARKYHPDTTEFDQDSAERMRLINEAYEVLIDKEKRARYNAEVGIETLVEDVLPEKGEAESDADDNAEVETPSPEQSQCEEEDSSITDALSEIEEVIVKSLASLPDDEVIVAAPLPASPEVQKTTPSRLHRLAPHLVTILLISPLLGVIVYLAYTRFLGRPADTAILVPATATFEIATPEPIDISQISLAPMAAESSILQGGITRLALLHTTIPARPRTDIITYTVELGDNLFSIAEKYGIKPETILWGNYDILEDNPHLLKPGQELRILPIDGVYYVWAEGDDLRRVAESFKADPNEILNYPGNRFDLTVSTVEDPQIAVGQGIIIPGGKRAFKDWGPPAITRSDPAVASYYGPGSCGKIYEGAIGTGSFVWPTTEHYLSGYPYAPGIHPAIDIAGEVGNPVFAADSGVVVYSGWSNYGYGYLLVIDHGNGWQTAYAHLSAIGASCGVSVLRGGVVASLGSTGNSTGPHLHFEMIFNGTKVNPLDFIQ